MKIFKAALRRFGCVLPTVFSMFFDPYKKSLLPRAYELPHFDLIPFTTSFVSALKNWHTDKEIELIESFTKTQLKKIIVEKKYIV